MMSQFDLVLIIRSVPKAMVQNLETTVRGLLSLPPTVMWCLAASLQMMPNEMPSHAGCLMYQSGVS